MINQMPRCLGEARHCLDCLVMNDNRHSSSGRTAQGAGSCRQAALFPQHTHTDPSPPGLQDHQSAGHPFLTGCPWPRGTLSSELLHRNFFPLFATRVTIFSLLGPVAFIMPIKRGG